MASIYSYRDSKGKEWYKYQIDAGINPETGKRKRIVKGGWRTKTEAKQKAAEKEAEILNTDFIPTNSTILLKDYFTKWITEYKKDVKEGTMIVHRYNVEHYIIPKIGYYKLKDYKLQEHQQFINYLYDEKQLATSTIRLINGTVHNAFKKAIALQMIRTNPCNGVEFRKTDIAKMKELSFWDRYEIDQFLETSKFEQQYIFYYFFLTAIYTGMRKGELMALQWSDVNFFKRTITVQKTRLYRKEKAGEIIFSAPKTQSGFRTLVMSDVLHKALMELKQRQMTHRDKYEQRGHELDFVFCYRDFSPVANRTINGALDRISKKAGVKKIAVHDLRHTHAVLLRQAGVSLEDIQGILGHKNPTATLIYAHITEEVKQNAMSKFDSLMSSQIESNGTKMAPRTIS